MSLPKSRVFIHLENVKFRLKEIQTSSIRLNVFVFLLNLYGTVIFLTSKVFILAK